MNLKQLEVFLAVAETASFSRGAETTFLTQSTASQHVSALEQEFGLKLFDRTGRGVFLTEGGKVLAEHAGRIFTEVREAEAAIARFKGVEDVILSVGGSNIPGNYLIPAALPRLIARFPSLRLNLFQGDSREVLKRVAEETLEIGVVGSLFMEDHFVSVPLGHEEILLVAARGHRWGEVGRIEPQELMAEPLIMRASGSGTVKTVHDALLKAGLDPSRLNVKVLLGSNEAVKHAVLGGAGVSFISGISVREELDRGELVAVAVQGVAISRHFHLVTRAGRELSPAAGGFRSLMTELYGVPEGC